MPRCRVVNQPDATGTRRWQRLAQRVRKASVVGRALEIDCRNGDAEVIRGRLRRELEPAGFRLHVRTGPRSVVAWVDQPGTAGLGRVSRTRSGR